MSRQDSASILELAQDVLKRLSKEMHQALHFRGQSSQMKQLMEWADTIRKSSRITDPSERLQTVPEDQPMEGVTDGAAAGHSLEQYLSASVAVARPGLEQMTQPPGPDTDHEMVSASSNRASAPEADQYYQTCTDKGTDTSRATNSRKRRRSRDERTIVQLLTMSWLETFQDPELSDDGRDQRDLVSNVTAQSASSAWRQRLIHREAEARREAKGKQSTAPILQRARQPRVVDEEGFKPIARHSELYRQIMQMLSMYACLSGPEKHAMETAGQISEETLRTLALALDEEDMAHVPVRDIVHRLHQNTQ